MRDAQVHPGLIAPLILHGHALFPRAVVGLGTLEQIEARGKDDDVALVNLAVGRSDPRLCEAFDAVPNQMDIITEESWVGCKKKLSDT